MTHFRRSNRRLLVTGVLLGVWMLAIDLEEAHASLVVSSLNLPNDGTFPGEQVGAAIQVGPIRISLESVVYTQAFSDGPMPGESFAIFSRNSDGTVGSSIFDAFALSYDGTTHETTAAATASFTFQANTSYWLMMVETPGTFGDWDNSLSSTYTSGFGVSIPSENASVSFFDGSYSYVPASEGLQLFQVNGAPLVLAVPEPSTLTLGATGTSAVLLASWLRRRRHTGWGKADRVYASRSTADVITFAR